MTPQERAARLAELERELTRRGVLKVSGGDALARGALDGVSFGFADEIGGALGGDEVRERMREELALAQRDRPVTTFAGGLAAGLIPGGVGYNVARAGARAVGAGRVASSLLGGGAVGSAYGIGSGTDTQSRALGGALGFGLGAAGAGAGEGAGFLAARMGNGVDPTIRAAQLANRSLTRATMTEADYARRLRTGQGTTVPKGAISARQAERQAADALAAGGTPRYEPRDLVRRANTMESDAGVLDEQVRDIGPFATDARAVYSVNGPGKSIIENSVEARARGIGPAVLDRASRAYRPKGAAKPARGAVPSSIQEAPPPGSYAEFVDEIGRVRRGENAQNYSAAYAETPPQEAVQFNLVPLIQKGEPEALAHANKLLQRAHRSATADMAELQASGGNANADDIAKLQAEITGLEDAAGQLAKIAAGEPSDLGARAVDYYQRGLGAMVDDLKPHTESGRSIANEQRSFNRLSDRLFPALGQARSRAASHIAIKESVEAGRDFFRLSLTEQDELLRKATTDQQHDALMVGILEALQQKIATGDTRAVLEIARKPAFLQALQKTARNPAEARKLLSTIRTKARQRLKDNSITGQSATAPTQEAIRDLTSDADDVGMGIIDDFIAAGGDPKVLGLNWLGNAWRNMRQPGIRNPQVSAEYAKILTTPATRQNMEALAARLEAARRASPYTPEARRFGRSVGVLGATAASRGGNGP